MFPKYTIVVPSRKRTHNIPTILELLPTAVICVDEREVKDYAPMVPKKKMLVHPPMDGLPRVWNWIIKEVKTEALIEIDDDFTGVKSLVGKRRFITDPEEILQLLENALQTIADLGLTAFTFNRSPNPVTTKPEMRPLRPVGPVCNAFGVMGAARNREYNPALLGRADMDWTLRTLLEDRLVLNDMRYYFDCGDVFGGRGGNVGVVGSDQWKLSCERLKEKWGRYLSFKSPGWIKTRQVDAMSIVVTRRNKRGQK